MARRSKNKKDKIRLLKARARKRGRAASHPTSAPTGLTSTSLDSLQDRDSFASQNVRVDPDEEAKQNDRSLRFRTACRFWVFGEYERAAASFREVLELEHDDPRFARYWLASCLFQLGSSDELDELLQQHDDNSGIWQFAQSLHAFRLRFSFAAVLEVYGRILPRS